MFLLDYIDTRVFLIALTIGLFLVYITTPQPEVIVKYPTPENADKLVFEDDSDNCYKFTTSEVTCPNDSSKISNIPIQRKVEYFGNKRCNNI